MEQSSYGRSYAWARLCTYMEQSTIECHMLGPGCVYAWNSLLTEAHVLGPGCVHTWNSLLTEGHVLEPGCVC